MSDTPQLPANLFAALPAAGDAEQFMALLTAPGVRVERIVSTGQASPPGFWYDQPQGEWVVLLRGEALLAFEGEHEPRRLRPGDWANIAPHQRHRVEWTHLDEATIWLAVHYEVEVTE